MTEPTLQELVAQIATENKLGFEKLRVSQLETERVIKELGKRMGSMGQNIGDAAEEFFVNSLEASPVLGGIRFDAVYPKVYGGAMGKQSEYDIVLVNGACAAVVEVKYKVHPSALDQLEAQLAKYKTHFPEHAHFTLYGGIAGMSIPDEVVTQAKARGLFVLKCHSDVLCSETEAMRAF